MAGLLRQAYVAVAIVVALGVGPALAHRLLLLVPMHLGDGADDFRSFANCTLVHRPFEGDGQEHEVDVLVLVSGLAPKDGASGPDLSALRSEVDTWVANTPTLRSGAVDFLPLDGDQYDRTRSSAEWVQGEAQQSTRMGGLPGEGWCSGEALVPNT